MKCSIMLHFIRVYTVCKDKNDLQTKRCNILYGFYPLYMGNPYTDTFTNNADQDEMLHFIRVYTVCKSKKDLKNNTTFL